MRLGRGSHRNESGREGHSNHFKVWLSTGNHRSPSSSSFGFIHPCELLGPELTSFLNSDYAYGDR